MRLQNRSSISSHQGLISGLDVLTYDLCASGLIGVHKMKIGVISDTHNPSVGLEPPPEVAVAFQGVDVIIDAGDIYLPSCLDWLEGIAPVYAVELEADLHFKEDSRVVNKKRVLYFEGHTIGLTHDLLVPGMVQGITEFSPLTKHFPKDSYLSTALETVFDAPVDIVIFGHTGWQGVGVTTARTKPRITAFMGYFSALTDGS